MTLEARECTTGFIGSSPLTCAFFVFWEPYLTIFWDASPEVLDVAIYIAHGESTNSGLVDKVRVINTL